MAWIEVHQSLLTHRKTIELAELLGLPEVYAAGHLIALWCWSLDNAPDASLPVSARIIAKAAQWPGDADAFVEALLGVGFLDADGDRCLIHDWEEYAGKLIDQRKANAQRQQAWRERRKSGSNPPPAPVTPASRKQSEPRNSDITVTSPLRNGATVPNPTQPNSTEQYRTKEEGESLAKHPRATQGTDDKKPTPIGIRTSPLPSTLAPEDDSAKATSFPRHFALTPDMAKWAARHLPELDVGAATDEWETSMRSNRSRYRYTDWTMAWYSAMRKAAEWAKERQDERAGAKGAGARNEREARVAEEYARRKKALGDAGPD